MQNSWKRGRRSTLWILVLGLVVWAFLIYWQGDVSLAGLMGALYALVSLRPEQIAPPYDSLLLDLGLLIVGGLFWTLFFGLFVLPLRKPEDGLRVAAEIGRGLLGRRPAALYVQNGRATDPETRSPHLLLLDAASAAVLRDESAYTRAGGPGLSFLQSGERLAGTLDLRIQRRRLGPLAGEDSFMARGQDETEPAYAARQARRQEASGQTRDGVEVAAQLVVDARVENGAGDEKAKAGKPAFGFEAEFAWRAMAHSGVAAQAPSDARGRQSSWDWLPVHLATDLWRETLRKFTLMDLFEARDFEGQSLTGLEIIRLTLERRLREAIVAELDEQGQPSQRQVSSPEYKLLRERGIHVVNVEVGELQSGGDEEERLLEAWSKNWQARGTAAKSQRRLRSKEKRARGEQAAANDFLRQVSSRLYRRLLQTEGKGAAPDAEETLGLLIKGGLEGAAGVPGLDASIGEGLQQMQDWLEGGNDGEST